MSLVQSLRALLKPNLVPTLVTDASLSPTGFNAAAKEFLPDLSKGVPLPEQFPSMMWLNVPSRLSLMRPATILLDGSAYGRFALHLIPVFHESGLQGTVCSLSDATSIAGPCHCNGDARSHHAASHPAQLSVAAGAALIRR